MAASSAAPTPHIFKALSQVRAAINKAGIAKDNEVTDGVAFKFRGIDSVMNEFSGPMSVAGMMILPSYSDPVVTERDTKRGKTFNTVVRGSFRAISTEDGSGLELGSFYGEANDTQDKSMAKAQSIALRQAYLQTFVVPLGPEMDPENTLHDDPAERQDAAPQASKQPRSKSEGQEPQPAPAQSDLTVAQIRMVTKKLADKGLSEYPQELRKINDILAWIAKQPAGESSPNA